MAVSGFAAVANLLFVCLGFVVLLTEPHVSRETLIPWADAAPLGAKLRIGAALIVVTSALIVFLASFASFRARAQSLRDADFVDQLRGDLDDLRDSKSISHD